MDLQPNNPKPADGDVSLDVHHASTTHLSSSTQNPQTTEALPSYPHNIPTLSFTLLSTYSPTNATNQANHSQSTVPLQQKCNCKGCPSFPPVQLLEQCGYSGCFRMVHYVCHANMIIKSNKDYVALEGSVFCTIGHQKEYVKSMRTDNLTWSNHGAGEKEDPRCSDLSH